jgi:Flp pilus assembly protein TadG
MMRLLHLFRDESASAAAEMALVLPILLTLMFGAFELGNYFQSEHVLQKAVRDAARYAARLPIKDTSTGTVNYDCSSSSIDSAAQTSIQEVARFNDPTGTTDSATSRLSGWTDDTMATVTLACVDQSSGDSYVDNGVYADFPNGADGKPGAVPVVTVSATVPYNMLFGSYVFGTPTLNLNATSQAAVIGA